MWTTLGKGAYVKKERENQSESDRLNESLAWGLPIRRAYGPGWATVGVYTP